MINNQLQKAEMESLVDLCSKKLVKNKYLIKKDKLPQELISDLKRKSKDPFIILRKTPELREAIDYFSTERNNFDSSFFRRLYLLIFHSRRTIIIFSKSRRPIINRWLIVIIGLLSLIADPETKDTDLIDLEFCIRRWRPHIYCQNFADLRLYISLLFCLRTKFN